MQRSALCRSRRELSNQYLLAKFGFDTAEHEPCRGRERRCREEVENDAGRLAAEERKGYTQLKEAEEAANGEASKSATQVGEVRFRALEWRSSSSLSIQNDFFGINFSGSTV